MSQSTTMTRPSLLSRLAVPALALLALVALSYLLGEADIVRKAAGFADEETPEGLGRFVSAANALVTPAVVAMFAVTPLACLVGAAALMFGNRRGLVIVGAALGTLVFVASIKGIVA